MPTPIPPPKSQPRRSTYCSSPRNRHLGSRVRPDSSITSLHGSQFRRRPTGCHAREHIFEGTNTMSTAPIIDGIVSYRVGPDQRRLLLRQCLVGFRTQRSGHPACPNAIPDSEISVPSVLSVVKSSYYFFEFGSGYASHTSYRSALGRATSIMRLVPNRGRNWGYPQPPTQIPASGFPAPGSYLR